VLHELELGLYKLKNEAFYKYLGVFQRAFVLTFVVRALKNPRIQNFLPGK
jgi:hypothetical protein